VALKHYPRLRHLNKIMQIELDTPAIQMVLLNHIAGWSSQVARRAHNPEVISSNLVPAPNQFSTITVIGPSFFKLTCILAP
jgi:hypothetical protein